MRVLGRACAAACLALALAGVAASNASARLHAVATKLPKHYRLVESAANANAPDEVCYDAPRPYVDLGDCESGSPLTVYTLRPGDAQSNLASPSGPEHHVTI